MSIQFAACLKFVETDGNWMRAEENGASISALLARTALRYGYALRFCKAEWDMWMWDHELPFEVKASPLSDASGVFAAEFQDPLDWEKIQFPTFLLELWQLPKVEAAMFLRIADGSKPVKKLISVQGSEEKPKPVSIYKMMDDLVALRARADIPNQRYYLNKKAGVLY